MTVKELIEKLSEFDPNLEVEITDGFDCNCYHTNPAYIDVFEFDGKRVLDIGIGGNNL